MTETCGCDALEESIGQYVDGALPVDRVKTLDAHLNACAVCRERVQHLREVQGLLEFVQLDEPVGTPAAARGETQLEPARSWQSRLGTAPWWFVSLSLHFLIIVLASLISMSIEPPTDNGVIMVTDLQPRPTPALEQENPKPAESALLARSETPSADSKNASDVALSPDILAKAELSDHFETIDPGRPDTHSAFGVEEAKLFHSESGDAGGGGTGGLGLDDVIGVGGAGARGNGGGFGGGDGTGVGVNSGAGRGSFGQRSGGGRKLLVRKFGGSPATENAVNLALEWLAYHQEADGHWDIAKYGGQIIGDRNRPLGVVDQAVSSLALLAFLGAGNSEKVGMWKENVQRAVAYLISQQDNRGRISGPGGYTQGMATLALAEAAGMARIPATREAAQKAIDFCTEILQEGEGSDKGAWRYSVKETPDISNSGWFIMALKSAKVAGLHVNPASFDGAIGFLNKVEIKSVPGGDNGYGAASSFKYMAADLQGTARQSAIGVLCRQFLGYKKDELQSSVDLFVKTGGAPHWGASKAWDDSGAAVTDLYYWYYGSLCAFQQGGDPWKHWNDDLKTALLPNQCKQGDDAGSWPIVGNFSKCWGRVGQTALAALCLEVYYRYQQLTPDR